jgi:hypothetical protein
VVAAEVATHKRWPLLPVRNVIKGTRRAAEEKLEAITDPGDEEKTTFHGKWSFLGPSGEVEEAVRLIGSAER